MNIEELDDYFHHALSLLNHNPHTPNTKFRYWWTHNDNEIRWDLAVEREGKEEGVWVARTHADDANQLVERSCGDVITMLIEHGILHLLEVSDGLKGLRTNRTQNAQVSDTTDDASNSEVD